jgi:stress response protein YsnF
MSAETPFVAGNTAPAPAADRREPITDANRGQAMDGSDITEEEHEMTLHAERPVTSKDTVPVERVRLGREIVTQDHEVSETLRKEQIDDPGTDLPGASR